MVCFIVADGAQWWNSWTQGVDTDRENRADGNERRPYKGSLRAERKS